MLLTDAPCPPVEAGTFAFAEFIGATYTVGRSPAVEAARQLVRTHHTIAVDIETYGLGADARRIKCVAIAVDAAAVVLDPRDPVQAEQIRRTLSAARELVFHNSSFDVPNLVVRGLMDFRDLDKVVDTLIYARLADPDERSSKSLGKAVEHYLGLSGEDALLPAFKALGMTKAEGYRRFDLDRALFVKEAALDPLATIRLLPKVREAALERLTNHPFGRYGVTGIAAVDLVEREQRINRIFLRRAARGIRVDFEFLDTYRELNAARLAEAESTLTTARVSPGHGGQLTEWLEAAGVFPDTYPRTPKTGAPSARADHLEMLDHPLAQAFVRHKQVTKVDADYLDKCVQLAIGGRVHPTVSILAASTGRMSASDPPYQQFPDDARGILLAEDGDSLTSIDWSQIEPVVAANVARDADVLAGYEDASSDLYSTVAETAGISRKDAKVVVLAQMYGEGMAKLATDLKISLDDAWALRKAVFSAMPRTDKLIRTLRSLGEKHKAIFTLSGRVVPVPAGQYGVAVHKAVNYFVQGSAYDVLADALVRIDEAGLSDAVYLAVHDELVVSTAAAYDINKIMSEPPERLCSFAGRVPVLRTDMVNLGERWASA